MGAWIETVLTYYRSKGQEVAPYVGAWIETRKLMKRRHKRLVAPYVGAWIETAGGQSIPKTTAGRTLRGCVD